MHYIFALFLAVSSHLAWAQDTSNSVTNDGEAGPSYGYIVLGAIVIAVVIFMLIRKQHRKFNE
ncbi:hypothetical protein [Parapedobacter lycopersici]|uniref:hypothetical protein n=1 Tax=Parapedobacter lycopersici TaxID=1864939 RepID=UPI00214DA193|nr:hypothetical protein [Parapedobacter lycopersici]